MQQQHSRSPPPQCLSWWSPGPRSSIPGQFGGRRLRSTVTNLQVGGGWRSPEITSGLQVMEVSLPAENSCFGRWILRRSVPHWSPSYSRLHPKHGQLFPQLEVEVATLRRERGGQEAPLHRGDSNPMQSIPMGSKPVGRGD